MRQRKIRGNKRRQKQIEIWRQISLTLDTENLLKHKRDLVKIWVHPWSGISIINSTYPQPNGKTKKLMVSALIEIYENWKLQLDKLGQNYYLKIWLYEPRFSNSQIVCSIGDSMDYYNNTFNTSNKKVDLNVNNYIKSKDRISLVKWQLNLDEDYVDNFEIENYELIAIKKGYVWIGGN